MVELKLSEWLKPEDFGTSSELTIVFLDEGQYGEFVDKDGKGKETFEITVAIGEHEKKKWTMNLTSQRTVSANLGIDTKQWIGQKQVLFLADQMVGNTMRKVVYAREKK